MEPQKDFNTESLLNEHGKDISGLADKMGRCYSAEKYEDFQDAVEKIILKVMDSSAREKLKSYTKESIQEFNDTKDKAEKEKLWDRIKFWVPVIISIVAVLVVFLAKK